MSESVQWSLVILGLLFIPVLMLVIRRQWGHLRVRSPQAEDNAEQSAPQQQAVTQQLNLHESIEVIARLVLDDQVEISEACLRLKVLLDHYDAELIHQAPYSVYATVYNALAHMPTHSARRQTNKKFLMKLDQQRFEIEARNREAVREASRALLDHLSERKTHG